MSAAPLIPSREQSPLREPAAMDATLGRLSSWLSSCKSREFPGELARGVAADAESVRPGFLFVALRDAGREQIAEAMRRGALAVVAERDFPVEAEIPVIRVQDAVRALGNLAAQIEMGPARRLPTCGVTGTFGKSSVIALLKDGLKAANLEAGIVEEGGDPSPAPHRFQRLLRNHWDSRKRVCVVEASASDLARGRLEGARVDVAVLTQYCPRVGPSQGSARDQLEAMLDLFRSVDEAGVAVLPGDEDAGEIAAGECRSRVVTYGIGGRHDVRGRVLRMDTRGSRIEVETPVGEAVLTIHHLGVVGVHNALAALSASLALGADLDSAARGIASSSPLPAHLQRVPLPLPFEVVLESAVQPGAIRHALRTLGALARGRVILVGGAAAEGEPGRPEATARVMEDLSDLVIATSAPSAGRNPMTLVRELMRGFRRPTDVMLLPDRPDAIRTALDLGRPGDIVCILAAGSGAGESAVIRDWCLGALEAEAAGGGIEE